MIFNKLVYRCDLCGDDIPMSLCYRVQHLIENPGPNPRPAGIQLVSTQEDGTVAFEQASDKVVCFQCCKTIRKTTCGG